MLFLLHAWAESLAHIKFRHFHGLYLYMIAQYVMADVTLFWQDSCLETVTKYNVHNVLSVIYATKIFPYSL